MSKIRMSLGIAAAMIVYAVAEANGVIGAESFDIGFYGTLAASVVVLGGGKCALLAR